MDLIICNISKYCDFTGNIFFINARMSYINAHAVRAFMQIKALTCRAFPINNAWLCCFSKICHFCSRALFTNNACFRQALLKGNARQYLYQIWQFSYSLDFQHIFISLQHCIFFLNWGCDKVNNLCKVSKKQTLSRQSV